MTFSYRHRKLIILLLLFILSVTASVFIFRSHFVKKEKPSTKKIVLTPKKKETTTTTDNETYYLVDIKGEVNNPGTYSMKKGSRVIDQTTPNMIQRISKIFERSPLISKEI